MSAVLRCVAAGPLVTVQDGGRPAMMRFGVPRSGPMDRLAHAAANLAVGNDADAPAIEVSSGGLSIELLDGSLTVAVAGADPVVTHDTDRTGGWRVLTVRAGERLAIRAGSSGGWTTLAVAGLLDAPAWLGHTATHAISGLGGGALEAGRELRVVGETVRLEREGEIPRPLDPPADDPIRVVLGPQTHHFADSAVESLVGGRYRVTASLDRMGARLDGPTLPIRAALSIPSEPIVRGSIQVAGDGVPTMLFADHQTTGGYPKIATIVTADLDRSAQVRPGDQIRFAAIEPADAIDLARHDARRQVEYLATVAAPGRTLSHRLAIENLVGGAHVGDTWGGDTGGGDNAVGDTAVGDGVDDV